MRAERINHTNFQGKLVITNHLSNKPNISINKVKGDIKNLIQKKDYNLYITQDYCKNEVCISAGYPSPQKTPKYTESLPVNAKASRFVDTAKNTIERHEALIREQQEMQWEKEQHKADKKELLELISFSFAFPFFMIAEEIRNFKTTINKLAKKLATKKG